MTSPYASRKARQSRSGIVSVLLRLPVVPDDVLERLGKNYTFSFWKKTDETHSAVRFCTSWATTEEALTSLLEDIKKA